MRLLAVRLLASHPEENDYAKRIITVGLLLALCFEQQYAQPQSPLPAPTGSYAVGRTIFN
ncbi:MAG: hypothetical protein U0Y68_15495 [Blastocatellia bacterium]